MVSRGRRLFLPRRDMVRCNYDCGIYDWKMELENLDVNQNSKIVSFATYDMLDPVCTVVKFRGTKASDDGSVLPEDSKIDAISTYVSEFLMTNCHIAKILGGD